MAATVHQLYPRSPAAAKDRNPVTRMDMIEALNANKERLIGRLRFCERTAANCREQLDQIDMDLFALGAGGDTIDDDKGPTDAA